ncbi:hypothetical protein [Phytoactinopolyspora mesophila]|uniref:Amino acid transporter n=1 Tax=Phytoactinopolyspora mesophila TaxID=2650750 RepID=A0A7K3M171_9ACTN|nr:hypothetical protein [Phytoactinopolyspora mesophila]NDL57043.1 hypothetical protein [Phytoactinopolyspora mesophila]
MGINDLSGAELVRLYGPWALRTPADVAELFAGYQGTWWVAGGWALWAFTGVERRHADIDPCVLRSELPVLSAHLVGRLDVWTATDGALQPLLPGEDVLPDGCDQVWTRRSALDPWEYDILLAPGTADTWVYRRDPTMTMPMADALWERDGVRYLQPEIQLLYKAAGMRSKDQADFEATLPLLDKERRSWLLEGLVTTLPGHPWIDRL